jgi:hypothetical protein
MKNILDFKLYRESLEEESNETSCKWCGASFVASFKDQECCSDEHLGMLMDREVDEEN